MQVRETDAEVLAFLLREYMLEGFELTNEQLNRIPEIVSSAVH